MTKKKTTNTPTHALEFEALRSKTELLIEFVEKTLAQLLDRVKQEQKHLLTFAQEHFPKTPQNAVSGSDSDTVLPPKENKKTRKPRK